MEMLNLLREALFAGFFCLVFWIVFSVLLPNAKLLKEAILTSISLLSCYIIWFGTGKQIWLRSKDVRQKLDLKWNIVTPLTLEFIITDIAINNPSYLQAYHLHLSLPLPSVPKYGIQQIYIFES